MFGKWTVYSGVGTWHYDQASDALAKARDLKSCTWVTVKDSWGGVIFS